jgi:hypothetical protein
MSRTNKQFLIGGIYILGALLISGGIYYSKNAPSCSDGIQNGKEEGIDCGTIACGKACAAPVQAVQVQSVQLVKTPAGDYDAAVQLYNPNTTYGVSTGSFDLNVGGQISNHEFYMLPGQTKNIVLSALKNITDGSTATATVKSIEWQKVATVMDNPFVVTREAFTPGAQQSAYEAVITNNSNFDFDSVDIAVTVTDSTGALLTTGTSNIQTVISKSDRSVKITWPFALPADARIHTDVSTNIFNNDNFIKTNGTQEKFQQYY